MTLGRAFSRAFQRAPRTWGGTLALVVVLILVAFPDRAWAGCGATDPGACMDNALYQGVLMLMALLWDINQTILLLARNVEALREWLVGDVLGTAFDAVVAGIQFPFWIAAAIAWLLFVIGYFLQALVDGLSWVSLKRLIQYGGLAMFLFHIGSQAMSVTETMRVSVGQGFAAIAGTSTSSSTTRLNFFATDDSSMDTPHTIYGDNPCPGMETKRATAGMYLNDYTANYLWADARDIHCPDQAEGRADVPAQFGERYAPPPMQIDDEYPDERQKKINLGWVGVSRMGWGFLLVIGALVEQVMHLLFALALASTWIGLLIALLFALFLPTEGMFKGQIDGILTTMRVSWLASFWMGLALSVLNLAALSGNGLTVGGVGLLTLGLAIWQTKTAGETFIGAMSGLSGVAGSAPSAVGGALKGLLGPAGMALGAVGALGSAAVGARDAYGSYKQGRELGLERWQALDHAQTAWNQRSLNSLSIWRNEQRRTKAMVREKLLDERLVGQVADLHAIQAQASAGKNLNEQMGNVADDTWADSRSYAAPRIESTEPVNPTVGTSTRALMAAPATGAVGSGATWGNTSAQSEPQPCPRCGQVMNAAHTCPRPEPADGASHAAAAQRPTATVAPTQTPGTASATIGTGRGGLASDAPVTDAGDGPPVVIVPANPVTAAIGDDPAIQEMLEHAGAGATEDQHETSDADRPDLVAASPTLALVPSEPSTASAMATSIGKAPSSKAVPDATAETSTATNSSGAGDESKLDVAMNAPAVQVAAPAAAVPTSIDIVTSASATLGGSPFTEPGGLAAPVSAPQSLSGAAQPTPVVNGTPAAPATPATSWATSVARMPGRTPESSSAGSAVGLERTLTSSSSATRSTVSMNSIPTRAVQAPMPIVGGSIGSQAPSSGPAEATAAGAPDAPIPVATATPTTRETMAPAPGGALAQASIIAPAASSVPTPAEPAHVETPSMVVSASPMPSAAGQPTPVAATPVDAAQPAPRAAAQRPLPARTVAATPVAPAHAVAPTSAIPETAVAAITTSQEQPRQRPWQRVQQRRMAEPVRRPVQPASDSKGRL